MTKRTATAAPARADLRELQQMWLSLMSGDWSSLVVVPTDPDSSASVVTGALAEAAAFHDLGPFQIIDALGASPAVGEQLAQQLASVVAGGSRAVAAVDSLMQSLGGVALVRDAQAALLVVRLGSSNFEYVQSTIDIIGRERILGAVTLPL
jgi:hypothetical protein